MQVDWVRVDIEEQGDGSADFVVACLEANLTKGTVGEIPKQGPLSKLREHLPRAIVGWDPYFPALVNRSVWEMTALTDGNLGWVPIAQIQENFQQYYKNAIHDEWYELHIKFRIHSNPLNFMGELRRKPQGGLA